MWRLRANRLSFSSSLPSAQIMLRQQSNYPLLKNMKLEKLRLYIPMNCISEWNQVRFQRSN